jgi:hypothetical protein
MQPFVAHLTFSGRSKRFKVFIGKPFRRFLNLPVETFLVAYMSVTHLSDLTFRRACVNHLS